MNVGEGGPDNVVEIQIRPQHTPKNIDILQNSTRNTMH